MASNCSAVDDESIISSPSCAVQLGFCLPIENEQQWKQTAHHSVDWQNDWDGGQAGGKPSWLHPAALPKRPLQCPMCNANEDGDEPGTMTFLCQLYAPLDDVETAFHRSLYVFGCRRHNTIRVLRTQLPRDNPYWPSSDAEGSADAKWTRHLPETYYNDDKNGLCVVCGFPATGRCPLQKQAFCGTYHQRLYKKYSNNNNNNNKKKASWVSTLPCVYDATEIVVEEEPELPKVVELANDDQRSTTMFEMTADGDDSDADLEQEDLNAMLTGKQRNSKNKKSKEDATYQAFVNRITERPNVKDQVLRYSRWNGSKPLWIRDSHQPNNSNDDIPHCRYCGAERQFEFQLQPQLLHYLKSSSAAKEEPTANYSNNDVVAALEQADSLIQQAPPEQVPPDLVEAKNAAVDRVRQNLLTANNADTIDWGVVAVYTCTNSCGGDCNNDNEEDDELGAYREEFAWRQPSIDDAE